MISWALMISIQTLAIQLKYIQYQSKSTSNPENYFNVTQYLFKQIKFSFYYQIITQIYIIPQHQQQKQNRIYIIYIKQKMIRIPKQAISPNSATNKQVSFSSNNIILNSNTNNTNNNNNLKAMKRIQNYSYCLQDQIGLGYSSKVYKGINQLTKQNVAVKCMELKNYDDDEIQKQLLKGEIAALQKIHKLHKQDNSNNNNNIKKDKRIQHLLKLQSILKTKNNLYIVTQLCEGTDLAKLLRTKKYIPQKQAQSIMSEIIKGYMVLNQLDIIHRDLKPANIFIKDGKMKIADFGFAMSATVNSHQNNNQNKYNVGSSFYMPPQALKSNKYSHASDIWAIGIIAYQLVFGTHPWRSPVDQLLHKKILQQPIQHILDKNPNKQYMSENYLQFICKCLQPDFPHRASLQYISNYNWQMLQLQLKQNIENNNNNSNSVQKILISKRQINSMKFIINNNNINTNDENNNNKYNNNNNIQKKLPVSMNNVPLLQTNTNNININNNIKSNNGIRYSVSSIPYSSQTAKQITNNNNNANNGNNIRSTNVSLHNIIDPIDNTANSNNKYSNKNNNNSTTKNSIMFNSNATYLTIAANNNNNEIHNSNDNKINNNNNNNNHNSNHSNNHHHKSNSSHNNGMSLLSIKQSIDYCQFINLVGQQCLYKYTNNIKRNNTNTNTTDNKYLKLKQYLDMLIFTNFQDINHCLVHQQQQKYQNNNNDNNNIIYKLREYIKINTHIISDKITNTHNPNNNNYDDIQQQILSLLKQLINIININKRDLNILQILIHCYQIITLKIQCRQYQQNDKNINNIGNFTKKSNIRMLVRVYKNRKQLRKKNQIKQKERGDQENRQIYTGEDVEMRIIKNIQYLRI